MTESEALEKVNDLHSKIVRSSFAENVTESEMLAFIECKKALEKQIPKKPIEMKPTDKLMNGYYSCPMCGGWVGMDEYSNNYCGCCGSKIDWSDE